MSNKAKAGKGEGGGATSPESTMAGLSPSFSFSRLCCFGWMFLVFTACSKITDPLAQPYVKEFRITGTPPGQQATLIVTSGAPGRINVSGTVPVPNPCFVVEPDVAVRGNGVIQVTLYARRADTSSACIQVLSVISYQAVLGDFKVGAHTLIVSHDSGSGPVVDFTKDVTVL